MSTIEAVEPTSEAKPKAKRAPRKKKEPVITSAESAPVEPAPSQPALSPTMTAILEGTFVGMTQELSNEEYHAKRHYKGSSQLKSFSDNGPEAFKYSEENPEEPTAAMEIGSALHSMTFEPDLNAVMIDPEEIAKPRSHTKARDLKTLQSSEYQDKVAKYEEAMKKYEAAVAEKARKFRGKYLLTPAEFDLVTILSKKLREDTAVHKLMALPGVSEISAFAKCPTTGLMIKCRFDRFFTTQLSAMDLKTTSAKNMNEFAMACVRYGYVRSVAHYLDTGSAAIGEELQNLPIIAIQKEAPYQIWPIYFSETDLKIARQQNQLAKEALVRCMETGNWTRPIEGFQQIVLPAFSKNMTQSLGEIAS